MHQSIDKKNKIITYLIFLLVLSTINNKTLDNQKIYFSTIKKIHITGLSNPVNLKLKDELDKFHNKKLFSIEKEEIKKIITEYNIIEEYKIKKIYPSILKIDIKQTKLIAKISSKNQLLVGANGKLIISPVIDKTLPYIYGKFNAKEFLNLKKNIDRSKFNFADIRSIFFFPSNRLDILTNENILIKLPENNLSKSLFIAHKIITNNEFKENKLVDLRVANHLVTQ